MGDAVNKYGYPPNACRLALAQRHVYPQGHAEVYGTYIESEFNLILAQKVKEPALPVGSASFRMGCR